MSEPTPEEIERVALELVRAKVKTYTDEVIELVEKWRETMEQTQQPPGVCVAHFAMEMQNKPQAQQGLCLAFVSAINLLASLPPIPKDHDPLTPKTP